MNVKSGIKINGAHSYYDYGLYLAGRDVPPPTRKTNFVEIPYMNGYYDVSSIARATSATATRAARIVSPRFVSCVNR